MLQHCWNFPSPSVLTYGYVYHGTNGKKTRHNIEEPAVPLERNLHGLTPCGFVVVKDNLKKSDSGKWMAETTNLGMPVRASSASSVPICVRGRHQNGWEEAQSRIHVEEIHETRSSGETLRRFLIKCTLGEILVDEYRTMFVSRNLYRGSGNAAWFREKWCRSNCLVLRHGRTCEGMRRTLPRIGKQKHRAVVQCGLTKS